MFMLVPGIFAILGQKLSHTRPIDKFSLFWRKEQGQSLNLVCSAQVSLEPLQMVSEVKNPLTLRPERIQSLEEERPYVAIYKLRCMKIEITCNIFE